MSEFADVPLNVSRAAIKECVYLIHGFASAPKFPSDKVSVLEQVFALPVVQLRYNSGAGFASNMEALKAQVRLPPLFFVGTSLGAFYASHLAEHFYAEHACMPIMLNPCHNPAELLHDSVGEHVNFATGERFFLSDVSVDSYRALPLMHANIQMPRWILLNMDDELIDAEQTQALFKNQLEVMTFPSGGHRFENIGSDDVVSALKCIHCSYFLHGVSAE